MTFEWERLYRTSDRSAGTDRAKVFGGWVVVDWIQSGETNSPATSLVFVPDAKHEWVVE